MQMAENVTAPVRGARRTGRFEDGLARRRLAIES
jgi:hypothetical protein